MNRDEKQVHQRPINKNNFRNNINFMNRIKKRQEIRYKKKAQRMFDEINNNINILELYQKWQNSIRKEDTR